MLSTKAFHELALPLLYNKVRIAVEDYTCETLSTLLSPGHLGHKYIRQSSVTCLPGALQGVSLEIVKSLLKVLPRDCLRDFSYLTLANIDRDTLELLSKNQRELKDLELPPLAEDALKDSESQQGWPRRLEGLVIPLRIGGLQDLDFYSKVLEQAGDAFECLVIRTFGLGLESRQYRLYNMDSADGELLRRLLAFRTSAAPARKWSIDTLFLQSQKLKRADTQLHRLIDLGKLKSLSLWDCTHMDVLLRCLIEASATDTPRLELLDISVCHAGPAPRLLEDLLRTFGTLQTLIYYSVGQTVEDTVFDIRCLDRHKSTLTNLYLGCGSNENSEVPIRLLSEDDLTWLCNSCQSLRQLAIPMPSIQVYSAAAGLDKTMVQLAKLKELAYLRILNWPTASTSLCHAFPVDPTKLGPMRQAYLQQLDFVATNFVRRFEQCRRPWDHARLSVITFGSVEEEDCIQHVDTSTMPMPEPIAYKVRSRVDDSGGFEYWAERIRIHVMRYEEPQDAVAFMGTDQGLATAPYD